MDNVNTVATAKPKETNMIKKAIVTGIVATCVGCGEQDPMEKFVDEVVNSNYSNVEMHYSDGIYADGLRAIGIDERMFEDGTNYKLGYDGLYIVTAAGDKHIFVDTDGLHSAEFTEAHEKCHHVVYEHYNDKTPDLGYKNEEHFCDTVAEIITGEKGHHVH